MTRVALYIRVSTSEQVVHGLSLEAQREALTKYAKEKGYSIVDVYADEGITARKQLKNRKELQRLLSDVKKDKIDFRMKALKKDKEGCYLMVTGSTQEEDITIVNIYAPDIGAHRYIQQIQTENEQLMGTQS